MRKQLQRREKEVLITSLDTDLLVLQSSLIKATASLEAVVYLHPHPNHAEFTQIFIYVYLQAHIPQMLTQKLTWSSTSPWLPWATASIPNSQTPHLN